MSDDPTPPVEVRKIAAHVPVTSEVFEDNRIAFLSEAALSRLQIVNIRDMLDAYERDRWDTALYGPMLRPTRTDLDRILEPQRRYHRKVRNMRYNLRWIRGHPAGRFRRHASQG